MSIRSLIMLVLAATCAAAASFGVYQYTAFEPREVMREIDQEDVVVLRVDVTRVGTELTADMLDVEKRPKGTVGSDVLRDISLAVGQSVVIPMFRGEPILPAKLGQGSGLAALVPEGMVAYSFPAPSESSLLAGFAMPNDRVDILLTRDDPSKLRGGKVTQRLLQNVRILAAGAEINRPSGNRIEKVRNVTVAIPPGTDQKLAMAQEVGSLALVLRGSPDDRTHPNIPVYLADLEGAEEVALVDKWNTAFSYLASSAKSLSSAVQTVADTALDKEVKRLRDELALRTRELEKQTMALNAANAKSEKMLVDQKTKQPTKAQSSTVLTIRGNSQSYVIVKPRSDKSGY